MIRLSSYLSHSKGHDEPDDLRDVLNKFNVKLIEAPDIPTATRKLQEILASIDFTFAYQLRN